MSVRPSFGVFDPSTDRPVRDNGNGPSPLPLNAPVSKVYGALHGPTGTNGLLQPQRKLEHTARVAHELRTPIGGILGLARLLAASSNLTPSQQAMVESIERCGRHMLAVANDLIDIDGAQSGRLSLNPQASDVEQELAQLRRWLQPTADTKSVSLVIEVQAELPSRLTVDAQRLRQVLLNLANNGIRHTRQGFVALRVRKAYEACDDTTPAAQRPWRWRFEVEDTGEGILPQDLPELFTPWHERQHLPSRPAAGAGLGLSLCNQLVAAMGGQLQVRSVPQQGCLFWFDLPGDGGSAARAPQ